ncbi:MAG TPA: protein kinase [Bryobacteraceae bacterium]|nr:protein kinase [Bryobacteraceae bacterium]
MATSLGPGSSLGHYKLVSRLGQGGMGQVFLAIDERLGRKVALKALLPELEGDQERTDRFLQEAKIASSLSHPNVAALHEIGEAAGLRFLALEYVEGESLQQKLAGEPLPLNEILSIARQIADALDAAHSLGIIHRDIKPGNVIVTPRGHVKLLDFGLAKTEGRVDTETQLVTTAGALVGTVMYMSPEQALGRTLDHRTDLFSLGAVMYQMITGRLPFGGANAQETIAHILQSQPEAIARFNYDTPETLERIVRKCLEKDRERRYATARDLLVDLESAEREASARTSQALLANPARSELTAVIVDDEELARGLLREYLSTVPDIRIAAECANGFEAVKAVAETRPDLIFLDVQMPKLDGFEVLELIGNEIAVIFVTAYDVYAMRAFDAHAVDYLLKPFSMERFRTALERVRQRLGTQAPPSNPAPAELSAAARAPEQHLQRIVVRDGPKVHILPVSQLDYAEAQDDYISLHSGGKAFLKQQTISSLEASLDPSQFVRIHRSVIVNISRIARIEPVTKDTRLAILTDGARLPLSRSGYERLNALLEGG